MKLNLKQPHGTIVGHEWARYEQNGVLFDGSGSAHEASAAIDKAAKKKTLTLPATEPKLKNAGEFLRNLLAGGPVDKSAVYKEAENNCQEWDAVKRAFVEMGGLTISSGSLTMWKLNPENVRGAQ
jgi:hypothetical protein